MQSSETAASQSAAAGLSHDPAAPSPPLLSALASNALPAADPQPSAIAKPADQPPSASAIAKPVDAPSDSASMQVDNSSENDEDVVMKDKLLPKVKQVGRCSYCECNSAESLKTVPCLACGSRCHIDCIKCTEKFKDKILLGDDFFHFKCFKCTDGNERFKRYHLSWVDVVHITLFNLTHNPPVRPNRPGAGGGVGDIDQFSSSEHGPQEYGDSRIYFHYKADVAKFIDQHWSYFWTKSRGETWINSASSALSTNSTENVPEDGRFESGKAKYNRNGMWALTDDLRFPSSYDSLQQQKTRTIMYNFAEDGSLVELRTQAANGRRKRRTDSAMSRSTSGRAKKSRAATGSMSGMGGYGSSSGTTGKRGRKREVRSAWSISMWPDIDNPQGPAHMSREATHAATQFVIESDRRTVWNDKGYRLAKASHGVETGAWYFEAEVLAPVRPEFNLRIGWSQISGELQAPCGFDVFSYSVRAKPATRFHAAIGSPYGEDYGPGDTLGMLIYLPTLDSDEKQDLADRKWRPGERYRQFTYSRPDSQRPSYADSELPPLPVLANSELVYFKNGKCLGPAFQQLYLGKYYPAISSYMGGKVRVNLGPDFKYPPPAVWHNDMPIRPISDLEFTLPEVKPEEAEVKTEEPEANSTKANGVAANGTEPSAAVPVASETKEPVVAEQAEAKDSGPMAVDPAPAAGTLPSDPAAAEAPPSDPAVASTLPSDPAAAIEGAQPEAANGSPGDPKASEATPPPSTELQTKLVLEPTVPSTENPTKPITPSANPEEPANPTASEPTCGPLINH